MLWVSEQEAAEMSGMTEEQFAAPPAKVVKPGFWGYSSDGELFYDLGVSSREEAIAECAAQFPEGGVTVAWCTPHDLHQPDWREHVTEYLCGCGGRDLEHIIASAAECAVEDADYEGELGAMIWRSDMAVVAADFTTAIQAAFIRHGRPELIGRDFDEAPLDAEDPMLKAMDEDEALLADLRSACERWYARMDLANAGPLTLHLSDVHEIPYDESA
jgi:hypothetical protein